ncbi:MAG TPA: C40 family peptidase [Bacteroidia bacterium]|nr:C40 family peptidase [Bacteroidia bacterium]
MRKTILVVFLLVAGMKVDAAKYFIFPDTTGTPSVCDSIVTYATSFLGTPYHYGCSSPKAGFDCSGFTWYVFGHYGIDIPRSAQAYATVGKEVSLSECRKGDIILFRGTHPGEKRVGHVGIIISGKGEPVKFIHASSSDNHRGVVITDYYSSHYPARFIKVIRIIPEEKK